MRRPSAPDPFVVSIMTYKDAELDPESESTYECFDCGTVVRTTSPDACPECGAELRNRRTPIE